MRLNPPSKTNIPSYAFTFDVTVTFLRCIKVYNTVILPGILDGCDTYSCVGSITKIVAEEII